MKFKDFKDLIQNSHFSDNGEVVIKVRRGTPAVGSQHTTEVTGIVSGFDWDSGMIFITLKEEVNVQDVMTKAGVRLLDKCIGSYSFASISGDKKGLSRVFRQHIDDILKEIGILAKIEESSAKTIELRERAKQARANTKKKNEAPWSEETIEKLKAHQENPMFHPYTCGNNSAHRNLVPTKNGWICLDCDYTQNWCH